MQEWTIPEELKECQVSKSDDKPKRITEMSHLYSTRKSSYVQRRHLSSSVSPLLVESEAGFPSDQYKMTDPDAQLE